MVGIMLGIEYEIVLGRYAGDGSMVLDGEGAVESDEQKMCGVTAEMMRHLRWGVEDADGG